MTESEKTIKEMRTGYIHVRASESTIEKLKILTAIKGLSQADIIEILVNKAFEGWF